MNRKALILTLVLVLIITTAILLYFLPVAKEAVVEPKPEGSRLYAALVGTGIEDAVVDVTPERALIRYNLPENMSNEATQYYIMASAATVAPASSEIIIQIYENFEPMEEVTVNTKDVLAFMNESITLDEFKERIVIKPLK